MGCRSDENNDAFLNIFHESVLLELVEMRYLVKEENSPSPAVLHPLLRKGDNLPDVRNSCGYGIKVAEIIFRTFCYQHGERCFPASGRAVKNHGGNIIAFNYFPQYFPFAEDMLLSGEAGKTVRPHPCGKRLTFLEILIGRAEKFFHYKKLNTDTKFCVPCIKLPYRVINRSIYNPAAGSDK